jgi:ankyrin repeat protein
VRLSPAVTAADRQGNTPLHAACEAGRPEAVRALLGFQVRPPTGSGAVTSADPRAANKDGLTPLALAAANGHPAALDAALGGLAACEGAGAPALFDVLFQEKGPGGKTILHLACDRGQADTVAFLVGWARANFKWGKAWEAPETAALLTAAKVRPTRQDVNDAIAEWHDGPSPAILKHMLAAFGDDRKALFAALGVAAEAENTALHAAVWHGREEAVPILLAAFGSDKEARRAYIGQKGAGGGGSALELARLRAVPRIIGLLEAAGRD